MALRASLLLLYWIISCEFYKREQQRSVTRGRTKYNPANFSVFLIYLNVSRSRGLAQQVHSVFSRMRRVHGWKGNVLLYKMFFLTMETVDDRMSTQGPFISGQLLGSFRSYHLIFLSR